MEQKKGKSGELLVPILSPGFIGRRIYLIRKQKVMLDSDLAELYGVTTSNLNKAVTRNAERFPEDFMLRLTREEYNALRFQIGILKRGQPAKYLPRKAPGNARDSQGPCPKIGSVREEI